MALELISATDADFEFAFEVKRNAMGPHIVRRWGWDDEFQREHHRRRWRERPWSLIVLAGNRVGTVSIDTRPTHVQFGEFYILEQYRQRGLGTKVLRIALALADEHQMETRLEYLKWNPVGTLYARHGFKIVSENDIHYFLVRPPRGGKRRPANPA